MTFRTPVASSSLESSCKAEEYEQSIGAASFDCSAYLSDEAEANCEFPSTPTRRSEQDENSEGTSGDGSIVAKRSRRRAKPISPTSTEQEEEPCQTTTVTKPKETITRLVCKRKSIPRRRVSAFANTKQRDESAKNIHVQYRRFDSNGKALFLIARTVQIDSSYSIGIRAIQIDQMDTIFFHSTHACQMVKWYHAVYNTVCRSHSNGSN